MLFGETCGQVEVVCVMGYDMIMGYDIEKSCILSPQKLITNNIS